MNGIAKIIKINDLNNIQILYTINTHQIIHSVEISSDEKLLIICAGKKAEIFDLTTRQLLNTISHGNYIFSSTLSPDDRYLITAEDKTAFVTDLNRQETLCIINHDRLISHTQIAKNLDNEYMILTHSEDDKIIKITDFDNVTTVINPNNIHLLFNIIDGKKLKQDFKCYQNHNKLYILDLKPNNLIKKCSFLQLKLISWLYTQKSQNIAMYNNPNLPIKLTYQQLDIYLTLPSIVQDALEENYNLYISNEYAE